MSLEDLSTPNDIIGAFTATAQISGQTVQLQSGTTVQLPVTQVVKISGEAVVTQSGVIIHRELLSGLGVVGALTANVSGQWLETHILSGTFSVDVSGQGVFLPATQIVKISGDTISITSGQVVQLPVTQVVKVSGETVDIQVPTIIKTGAIKVLDDNSGGGVLASGATRSVTVKAMSYNSGIIYVGGSGIYRPYSGYGFALEAGEGKNYDVANFDAIYVMSTISGFATITFDGVL